MNKLLLLVLCLFISTIAAQKAAEAYKQPKYDFAQQGRDWKMGQCATGKEQSPIDLNRNATIEDPTVKLFLQFSKKNITTTLKESKTSKGFSAKGQFMKFFVMDLDGELRIFKGWQLHFHAPAEHTIDGVHRELCMHMIMPEVNETRQIHKKNKRDHAVFTMHFNSKPGNPDSEFFNHIGLDKLNQKISVNFSAAIGNELQKLKFQKGNRLQMYSYFGSLTSPNCDEIINWYILKEPLAISERQLKIFTNKWGGNPNFKGKGNNRFIQPLNNRTIKLGEIIVNEFDASPPMIGELSAFFMKVNLFALALIAGLWFLHY